MSELWVQVIEVNAQSYYNRHNKTKPSFCAFHKLHLYIIFLHVALAWKKDNLCLLLYYLVILINYLFFVGWVGYWYSEGVVVFS